MIEATERIEPENDSERRWSLKELEALEAWAIFDAVWDLHPDDTGHTCSQIVLRVNFVNMLRKQAGISVEELRELASSGDEPTGDEEGEAFRKFWRVLEAFALKHDLVGEQLGEAIIDLLGPWHQKVTGRIWEGYEPPAFPVTEPEPINDPAPVEPVEQAEESDPGQTAAAPDAASCRSFVRRTFEEAKTILEAVSSRAIAPASPRWFLHPNGDATHRSGGSYETRVKLSDLEKAKLGYKNGKEAIDALDSSARLLLEFCISVASAAEGKATTVPMDDILDFLRFRTDADDQGQGMRDRIWKWLRVFGCLELHGKRFHKYRTSKNEWEPPSCKGPLIIVTRAEGEATEGTPANVVITPGEFILTHGDNPKVLSFFGDLNDVAGVRDANDAASGQMAQAILLSLYQLWRENQSKPDETAFVFRIKELLVLSGEAHQKLDGAHPALVREYFGKALNLLKQLGLIGEWRPLDGDDLPRARWKTIWLAKRIEVLPNEAGMGSINRLRKSSRGRETAISRKREAAAKAPK
jgi:hypothetical protein